MKFLCSFLRHHLAGKQVVVSPNVGCFLRLRNFIPNRFDKLFNIICVISNACRDNKSISRSTNVSVKSKLQHAPPPGHTPGIWHLCRPGEEGIWLSESSRGWGIWSPCFRGGEFELHPRFHVKSLAWQGSASYHGGRGVRGFSWKRLCLKF